MEIGKTIRALRAKKGVTQEQAAACLGVSCQAVSKWETNVSFHYSNYTIQTIKKQRCEKRCQSPIAPQSWQAGHVWHHMRKMGHSGLAPK